MVKNRYSSQVNQRIALWKERRILNEWRIYTEMKIHNNQKKAALDNWLKVGYSAETINLFRRFKNISLGKKNRLVNFQNKLTQNKARGFIKHLFSVCEKKHTISRLFMDKFCFYQIHKLKEEFFSRVKNFYREK